MFTKFEEMLLESTKAEDKKLEKVLTLEFEKILNSYVEDRVGEVDSNINVAVLDAIAEDLSKKALELTKKFKK